MSDLSDDDLPEWTSEELLVLSSADDDAPPSHSLPATLAAVGMGGALASGAAAAKAASVVAGLGSATGGAGGTTLAGSTAAKWTTLLVLSKWVGGVALGGALVAGTAVLVRKASPAPSASVALPAAAVRVARPPEQSIAPAAVAEPDPTSSVVEPREDPSPSVAVRRAPTAPPTQPDISLEIAALDQARTALRQGRPADALAALDRYRTGYGKAGSLRVEATVLRIDALLRTGERARAAVLADAFLAQNPKSPYAARVRVLMAGQ
jgi:hypothetical protein